MHEFVIVYTAFLAKPIQLELLQQAFRAAFQQKLRTIDPLNHPPLPPSSNITKTTTIPAA